MSPELLAALAEIVSWPSGHGFANSLNAELDEFQRLSEERLAMVRRATEGFRRARELAEGAEARRVITTLEREVFAEFVRIDGVESVIEYLLEEVRNDRA